MLFTQLKKNKRKTKWLMVVFFILTVLFGNFVGFLCDLYNSTDSNGNIATTQIVTPKSVIWATVISIAIVGIYMYIVLHKSINIVMAMNHGKEIHSRDEAPILWDAVSNMSLAANLPMPRVFIINDPAPNAFSTGNDPYNSAIGATKGLLDSMDQYEVEGVIGHEMSHIKDQDTKVETIGIVLTSIFAFIGGLLWRLLWDASWFPIGGSNNKNSGSDGAALMVAGLVLALISWIFCSISYLAQMALSRNREYLADAGSVDLTRNPNEIINALKSLEDRPQMKAANPSSNALYIVNPHKPKHRWSIANLFDTHPPLDKRIHRLELMKSSGTKIN